MPFHLSGPPEEAARELCRQLGLHQNAPKELVDNGDGTYNCRKCSDELCPYNLLGDALSASPSLDQLLAEAEQTLVQSLQLIRQIRQQEEHRKVDP